MAHLTQCKLFGSGTQFTHQFCVNFRHRLLLVHTLVNSLLMHTLKLYSTDSCSLCDKTLELLFALPASRHFTLEVIDIALDDQLVDELGEKIPVLESGGERLYGAAVLQAESLQNWLVERIG